MTLRKIDLMHNQFGFSPGHKCKECSNFSRNKYHDYAYSKCAVYGCTQSAASDWSGRYDACGMFNKEYNGGDIIRMVRPSRNSIINEPLKGQIDIFGEEI